MSAPRWTPGPLERLLNNVVTKDGRTVATVYDPHAMTQITEESKATTELFAAAPELYECEEASAELHFNVIDALKRVPGTEDLRRALYELRDKRGAALAKARGES